MNALFIGEFFKRLNEGGPLFMYTNFIVFLICIGLLVLAFLKGDEDNKLEKLIHSFSLFALVWGFLGFMIGMIGAFDAISSTTGINQAVFSAGLKVALLCPTFGSFIFVVVRLGIIGLQFKKR